MSEIEATMVVGASRGLGRGIAAAFAAAAGAGDTTVIAVARNAPALAELAESRPGAVHPEVADARDPAVAARLLDRHDPRVLIVVAGAQPVLAPFGDQTWETFAVNWEADVRIAFHWLQAALAKPLRPGSRVVVFSSGAALAGSPLSGGYAGAKATQRFMAAYARDEAERAGLGIGFTAILPRITAATDLGRPAVEAYAARRGVSTAEYLAQMGDPVTPESAGAAMVELVGADVLAPAYMLTGAGLKELS